jgi:tetratricopeptide (TPR) repeat protein
MIRRTFGRQRWIPVLAVLAALLIALPAAAQSTGMVKGKVVDDKGQPVENAKITIDFLDGVNRKQETKTNKKGEFIQIGLFPGNYKVTAEKEKLGSQAFDVRVRIGSAADVNFQLIPGASAGMSKEEAAKNAELKKTFEEGVAASQAGNFDAAVAAFTHGTELNANCYDCWFNIGYAYNQKKDNDKAEAAYKKAIELKPDYAAAYNALATLYNNQRKFDLAAEMSAKATQLGGGGAGGAGGGASADALYNQGVILWNSGKVAEAKVQFESAIQANPNHAESHYQLGMVLVNEGNLAGAANEFDTYLKLAPEGPNAAQAKALVAQLKK